MRNQHHQFYFVLSVLFIVATICILSYSYAYTRKSAFPSQLLGKEKQIIQSKNDTSPSTTTGSSSREMCGYNPPDDYCLTCDAYYLKSDEYDDGQCGETDKSCVMQCPNAPRCTSDPTDYCEGYCCKDFQCVLFFGCKYECSYEAVGCGGVCCEKREEVSKDFWDKAADKGAQWFIKRASKFVFGGCGLFCRAFIEFLFYPRQPGVLMSIDCWKLPSQTVQNRTADRDKNYPILDDTLLTSDVISDAFEGRRLDYNYYYNKEIIGPNLDAAFVIKVKIPETHSEFTSTTDQGGIIWMEEWTKQLYDDFSGCNDCCQCASKGKALCLSKCSGKVKISFNYNIKDYAWPDWDFNYTKFAESKYSSSYRGQMRSGFFFNNSLLFREFDFSDFTNDVATFPLFGKDDYEGVLVGCHVYPSPDDSPNTGTQRSCSLLFIMMNCLCILFIFLHM